MAAPDSLDATWSGPSRARARASGSPAAVPISPAISSRSGGVGQIVPVQANVRYPDSLMTAAEDADAVVNLVGILFASGKQTFKTVQDEGARNVAEAAKAAGVGTFVHVSAIGADASSAAIYAQSKAAGEAGVRAVYPDATIVRPSVVFGPEDQFFNRFGAMARLFPALPLIGGGHTRFQPVFVGDVAQALVAAIEGRTRTARPTSWAVPRSSPCET